MSKLLRRDLRGVSVVSELLFELAPFKTAKLCLYDFPYNERMKLGVSDAERTAKAIKGIVGKHLTYRRPHKVAQSSGY